MNTQMPFGTKPLEPVLAVAVVRPGRATTLASQASVAARSWQMSVNLQPRQLHRNGYSLLSERLSFISQYSWYTSCVGTLHYYVVHR